MADIPATDIRDEVMRRRESPSTFSQFLSVVGVVFFIFAFYSLVADYWDDLSSIERVGIIFIPGAIAYVCMWNSKLSHGNSVYFALVAIISAALQTIGLFTAVDEFYPKQDNEFLTCAIIFAVLSIEYILVFVRGAKRTAPMFFASFYFVAAIHCLLKLAEAPGYVVAFSDAVIILSISYALQKTPYRSISSFGYLIGTICVLSYDILHFGHGGAIYRNDDVNIGLVLSIVLSSALIFMSGVVRSYNMLIVATLYLLINAVMLLDRYVYDSFGMPLCLVIIGCFFIIMGKLFLTLHKKISQAGA